MTATTRSAEDGTPDPGNESSQTHAPETEATDGLLVGMASPDRCAECGAEMAVDQRYCVECGNRRGPARFTLQRKTSARSTAVVPAPASSSPRTSPAILAATGIVIALLALGVGVLIGHDGKTKTVQISVPAASSTSGKATTSGGSTSGGKSSGGGSTKAPANNNFFGG